VLQLLSAVGGSPTPVSLTEAAALVGLVPSTALRQLRSLEAADLLVRSNVDQLYRPGPRLIALAKTVFVGRSFASIAQPFIDQLAVTAGESAYLAVSESSRRACYVAASPGHHALRHTGWLGRSFATASTAVGAALRGRIDADGTVSREGALEPGITAISAPIRSGDGIVGAVSVIGPTFRLVDRELCAARRAVADCARQLSNALGA
jgi:IclR family transcriptional regulator, acetate operon repressor